MDRSAQTTHSLQPPFLLLEAATIEMGYRIRQHRLNPRQSPTEEWSMGMKKHVRFRVCMAIVSFIGLLLILWLSRWAVHHDMVSGPVGDNSQQSDRLPPRMTTPPDGGQKQQRLESHRSALRRVGAETTRDGAKTAVHGGQTTRDGAKTTGDAAETPSWTIEVVVTDRITRMLLGGATVSIESDHGERTVATCKTDSEGRCQVTLGLGTFTVAAEHDLYHRDSKAIARPLLSGASAKFELALRRKARIRGVVRNQFGEPVPRAEVVFNAYQPEKVSGWFGRGVATSDEEGFFECHVIEGQFLVYAYKIGHKEWEEFIFVTGEDRPPVIITLEETSPLFRVSGNILDQLEHSIPGARICVELDTGGEKYCWPGTDANEEGFYSWDVERGERTFVVMAQGFDEMRKVVDVKQDMELNFRLSALPSFKVRVLDWNGRVVSNARLHGTLLDGSQAGRSSRWIFGPGREPNTFDSRIYPFLLHINALDSGAGISLPLPVKEYQPEITVQLEQGGHILGRVVNADYEVVVEFRLSIKGPDGIAIHTKRHSQDGSFRLDHLPPGDYRIAVVGEGVSRGGVAKLVSIEVGQTAVVEMVFKKNA